MTKVTREHPSRPGQWKRAFLRQLGKAFELIRGPRVLTEITTRRSEIESLSGYSSAGYAVNIFCMERKYVCTYRHWWVRNRTVCTYTVFSRIDGDAPEALMNACAIERTFPILLNPFAGSLEQKKAAIEAYLDLVLKEASTK